MIDAKLIQRAAHIMIRQYGPKAAEKANARYHLLSVEGYEEAARIWMDVTKAICALTRARKR
jgi:hypothetical protein